MDKQRAILDAERDGETAPAWREVCYEYTPRLPQILEHLNASLLITTYQAGKLLVLGVHEGKLTISFLDYDQPMGLAVRQDRLAVGLRRQIHFLVSAHETVAAGPQPSAHDGCFVPRSSFYTGLIHGHDLAWGTDGLWVVNTLFSCLATLHDGYSFVPRWRPPFISGLTDQDRCHLNGLALDHGKPRYVTAMAESDEPAGWRPTKATSGVVIDVASGHTVCGGFATPHSPRMHEGRLWVLNSGCGSLGIVDTSAGRYEAVESVPGYTRGLAIAGQFAFVGLSKTRETAVFGGVPIAEKRDELRCGVAVVDLVSGQTVAVFQFLSGVSEIFAVDVLLGLANPAISGAAVDQQEKEVWLVPGENSPRPVVSPQLPLFANRNSTVPEGMASVEELVVGSNSLLIAGDWDAAAEHLEQAVAASLSTAPGRRAPLLVDLGNIRQDQGLQELALVCYQRAVEADPECTPAWQNLGFLWFNLGETEKAADAYDRLLERDPSPLNQLLAASVLPIVYDSREELAFWRRRQVQLLEQLVQRQATVDATTRLVPTCFFAAYQGLCDRELMALRGQVIRGRDFVANRPGRPTRVDTRKRVGFISAYFRDHTIGRLNLERIRLLDREQFHITVVLASRQRDFMVESFERATDELVVLPRQLPVAIQRMNELDLDLLVHADVGMDALTSTLAFSRFAPVQAATWGHPDTTGSPMIDYFISSSDLETDSSDEHYTERLIRMPSLGTIYERIPPRTATPETREQLGLPVDRHVYLCPQTLFKFHPDFDDLLADILAQDTRGVLVLLEGRVAEWTHRLKRRLRRAIPEFERRVLFLSAMPREDYLQLLAASDVVLDPLHFGGGNSSLEAVAMGAPVVTLSGQFLRSRITLAIHRQIGMTELIADSKEAYIRQAVTIASDPQYRHSLYERLQHEAAESLSSNPAAMQDWNAALASIIQP